MIKQLKQNSRNQREEHDSHVEQFVIRAFGVVIHDAATQPRVHEDRGQPRDIEFLPDGSDASLRGGVPRFIPVPQEEYFGRDLRQGRCDVIELLPRPSHHGRRHVDVSSFEKGRRGHHVLAYG